MQLRHIVAVRAAVERLCGDRRHEAAARSCARSGLRAEPVRRFYRGRGAAGRGGGGGLASRAASRWSLVLDSRRRPRGSDAGGARAVRARGRVLSIDVAGVEPGPADGRADRGGHDRPAARRPRARRGPERRRRHERPRARRARRGELAVRGLRRLAGVRGGRRREGARHAGRGTRGQRGAGRLGTVGSPAAAPGVLAVGALDGGGGPALPAVRLGLATGEGRALLRGTLLERRPARPLRAPVAGLSGPSQADPRAKRPRSRRLPARVLRRERRAARQGQAGGGAGPNRERRRPGDRDARRRRRRGGRGGRSSCASPTCTARSRRSPDGGQGIPVIGLRGAAAKRALELTPHDGGLAFVSAPERAHGYGPVHSGSAAPRAGRATRSRRSRTSRRRARSASPAQTSWPEPPSPRPGSRPRPPRCTRRAPPHGRTTSPPRWSAPPARSGRRSRPARASSSPKAALAARVLIEPSSLSLPRELLGANFSLGRTVTVRNPGSASVTVHLAARLAGPHRDGLAARR